MTEPGLRPGMRVRVRERPVEGHVRTPFYIRGRLGRVERLHGRFPDPEHRAYGGSGLPPVPLYLVRFRQADLWPDYAGGAADSLLIDLYEHWLEPLGDGHGA